MYFHDIYTNTFIGLYTSIFIPLLTLLCAWSDIIAKETQLQTMGTETEGLGHLEQLRKQSVNCCHLREWDDPNIKVHICPEKTDVGLIWPWRWNRDEAIFPVLSTESPCYPETATRASTAPAPSCFCPSAAAAVQRNAGVDTSRRPRLVRQKRNRAVELSTFGIDNRETWGLFLAVMSAGPLDCFTRCWKVLTVESLFTRPCFWSGAMCITGGTHRMVFSLTWRMHWSWNDWVWLCLMRPWAVRNSRCIPLICMFSFLNVSSNVWVWGNEFVTLLLNHGWAAQSFADSVDRAANVFGQS